MYTIDLSTAYNKNTELRRSIPGIVQMGVSRAISDHYVNNVSILVS